MLPTSLTFVEILSWVTPFKSAWPGCPLSFMAVRLLCLFLVFTNLDYFEIECCGVVKKNVPGRKSCIACVNRPLHVGTLLLYNK